MKLKWSALLVPVLLLACMTASADDGGVPPGTTEGDGTKTLKSMTGGNIDNLLTVTPEEIGHGVSEAEHAFIDMMKFYVPAQAADGTLLGLLDYYDVDGAYEETQTLAKPLVGVFLYGPAIGVPNTAFAHSFMDTYAAVSRDDGLTWKKTNLSQSADLSSFTLGLDGNYDNSDGDELPADHNKIEKDDGLIAFHAPGMDYPYANMCTDCHGASLEGGHHSEPSCYSCHGPEWKEDAPDGVTVVYIEEAYAKVESSVKIKVDVEGEVEGLKYDATATLINGVTNAILATEKVDDDGEFEFEIVESNGLAPCTVAVVVDDARSPVVPVIDKNTKEPIEECEGEPYDLTAYPGGTYNVFQATAGNKMLVAWPSRFCKQGQPAYSFAYRGDAKEADLTQEMIDKRNNIAEYLGVDIYSDLYLTDLFEVAGSQRSIDFSEEGYPQAGEVPFGCVWTARGVLMPDEVGGTKMVWTKPERLTSGRRDPNRIEVKGVKGVGFVITWQEDPDGLRPGQGLGPGEGWSGAVAHDKTDVWYSFIPWEYFDLVEQDADNNGIVDATPINIAEHNFDTITGGSGRPQVFVPMAMPMRLTNNAKCNPVRLDANDEDDEYFSYCNVAFAAHYGFQDFCASRATILAGQTGETEICINEDDLPNFANTASTRPRLSLQGYDSDTDGVMDRAWVIVAAEESKGLGRTLFLPDGTPCFEEDENPDCEADIGKNQWYFSFDMGDPTTSDTAAEPYGLVKNLVNQGNMLNQPEVNWRDGLYYPAPTTNEIWTGSVDLPDFPIYRTEIARRSSLLVQSIAKAKGSDSGILATPSWKQGVMRQGGPADTMLRRIVLPDGYADGIANNPYAFSNMDCVSYFVDPGDNPYYPDGICNDPAINLSSVVPDTCIDDDTGADIDCPSVVDGKLVFLQNEFGGPILRGYTQGDGDTTRVLTWHQCPSEGAVISSSDDMTPVACGELDDNLKDQSWYNPLDISKGHRGFIDGDFVMFLYAWSPNWRLNAKGNDRYDLYVRRSFDGGQTWRTTPADGTASDGVTPYGGDGTVTCENYRSSVTQAGGEAEEPTVCYDFAAGAFEHARNVTQHRRMKVTTLDPRYAPTAATITDGCLDILDPTVDSGLMTCNDLVTSVSGDYDLRDPSRYFMVFETGDNSTVQVGEAEPEDLFYSRAVNFGDDYEVWFEAEDGGYVLGENGCYPSDPHGDDDIIGSAVEGSGFCNEFDRMNAGGDTHSSEANLEANPDGSKLYGVWAQWVTDEVNGNTIESDAKARRIWWIDDYISSVESWLLPGENQPE